MPNTNPQAIMIANEKIRVLADKFGQLYNLAKMAQAEHQAEDWLSLFPNDAEIIEDGSLTDGRTRITNTDVRTFMVTVISGLITTLEASTNLQRNNVLKIAVHPEPR